MRTKERATRSGCSARSVRALLLFGLCSLALAGPVRAASITEFPLLVSGSQPLGIAAAPDGNVWFTEFGGSRVGRITPAGRVDDYSTGSGISANSGPNGIVTGPDGDLWFTEETGGRIGQARTRAAEGDRVLELPERQQLASRHHQRTGREPLVHRDRAATSAGSRPTGRSPSSLLTAGGQPTAGSRRARTATSGSPSRPAGSGGSRRPGRHRVHGRDHAPTAADGIIAGPDGNLWFTETTAARSAASPRRGRHRVLERDHAQQHPVRDHRRTGWQPLVHRADGNRIGRITPAGWSPSIRPG